MKRVTLFFRKQVNRMTKRFLDKELKKFEESDILAAIVLVDEEFEVVGDLKRRQRKKAQRICDYLNRPEAVLADKIIKCAMRKTLRLKKTKNYKP